MKEESRYVFIYTCIYDICVCLFLKPFPLRVSVSSRSLVFGFLESAWKSETGGMSCVTTSARATLYEWLYRFIILYTLSAWLYRFIKCTLCPRGCTGLSSVHSVRVAVPVYQVYTLSAWLYRFVILYTLSAWLYRFIKCTLCPRGCTGLSSVYSVRVAVPVYYFVHSVRVTVQVYHFVHSVRVAVPVYYFVHSVRVAVPVYHFVHSVRVTVPVYHFVHSVRVAVPVYHFGHCPRGFG